MLITAGFTASASFANEPVSAAARGGGAVSACEGAGFGCAGPVASQPPVSPTARPSARIEADSADLFIRVHLPPFVGCVESCPSILRSEEHTSELQSHSFTSYAVFS